MDNGQDADSYYQPQNGGNYHHQQSGSELHQSRSSINHQDVVMARESPYSKDAHSDLMMPEENGGHTVNGTSSKYSLLQFAAQHFRHE